MHLALDNIALSLTGKQILSDVSLEVLDGEFVSILGESGAGKSTVLKVIAGLLAQDDGTVSFDGAVIDDLPTHQRHVSIVFQDIRLFPNMSVAENVAFSLKMQGVGKKERLERAEELLCAVRLDGYGTRKTRELSGGQQQRVALARALAAQPRCILLDEPFSGLDEQLRDGMRSLVLELHERFGMTSLMVTHDPDEALTMSDRILYMKQGRLIQSGTPAQLLTQPADESVRQCFADTSALKGTVADGRFAAGRLVLDAAGSADGPAVLVRVDGELFVHALEGAREADRC